MGPLSDDIALFKLEKPVDFETDKHIVPVCLAKQSTNVEGMTCSTSGWGSTRLGQIKTLLFHILNLD
jgi:hypothetical protein